MRKKWTPLEESYLRDMYTHAPIKLIAKQLNRTGSSVSTKASFMGLSTSSKGTHFKKTRRYKPFKTWAKQLFSVATVPKKPTILDRLFTPIRWILTGE